MCVSERESLPWGSSTDQMQGEMRYLAVALGAGGIKVAVTCLLNLKLPDKFPNLQQQRRWHRTIRKGKPTFSLTADVSALWFLCLVLEVLV